jgi:hypothetical protein
MAQLCDLLAAHQFTITRKQVALFMPPTRLKFAWKIAQKMETLGRVLCSVLGWHLGGVLVVEAEKKLHAPIRQPVVEGRQYRPAAVGARAVMTNDTL